MVLSSGKKKDLQKYLASLLLGPGQRVDSSFWTFTRFLFLLIFFVN